MTSEPSKKSGFQEIGSYFFRKKDHSRQQNFNIRAMHTINKISILMFLIGVIMVIIKLNTR